MEAGQTIQETVKSSKLHPDSTFGSNIEDVFAKAAAARNAAALGVFLDKLGAGTRTVEVVGGPGSNKGADAEKAPTPTTALIRTQTGINLVNYVSSVRGKTLLQLACRDGDVGRCRLLLSRGARLDTKTPGDGYTAVHFAASSGSKAVLRLLTKAGAALDPVAPGGWTPLHMAIQQGHRDAADFLSAYGASIHAPTQFRLTPLHLAVWYKREGIAADLIWRGAKIDSRDRCGRTSLHLACWCGHPSHVRMLLRHGAKARAADSDGNTPLHDAALNNNPECIQELSAAKDVPWNVWNKFGHTALHEATHNEHTEAVRQLLKHGIDVNAKTSYGCSSLHQAVALENQILVQSLIDSEGIDINSRTTDGNTPLHWAVWYSFAEVVAQLLKAGVDTTLTDNGGNTPMHWAAFRGNTAMTVRLLSSSDAPLTMRNEAGKTPMDLARDWSHYECAAFLLSAATGEAFTPLVPQRLSSVDYVNEDERPLVSFGSGGFQRVCQEQNSVGPGCGARGEMEVRDSYRNHSEWLNSMKAPAFARQISNINGRSMSVTGERSSSSTGSIHDTDSESVDDLGDSVSSLDLSSMSAATSSVTSSVWLAPYSSPTARAAEELEASPTWKLSPDDLTVVHDSCSQSAVELGVGPWGAVVKGRLYDSDKVAIRMFPLNGSSEQLAAVMRHLDHLNRLHHPSLVMFLGAAFLRRELWLVTELIDGHTLHTWMGSQLQPWNEISWRAALATARALNYLHKQRPPIVHGNICSTSVMLEDGSRCGTGGSGNVTAKLVGLKMMALHQLAMTTPSLTSTSGAVNERERDLACSAAPEVAGGSPPGPASDVYCLGLLLQELCGDDPVSSLHDLISACTRPGPGSRVTAAACVRALEQLRP